MEHFVSLEIWAVLVAAPCIIAWFLGDLHGAARVGKMIGSDDLGDLPVSNTTDAGHGKKGVMPMANTEPPLGTDAIAAKSRQRDVQAQAERIREIDRVWDDPGLREDLRSDSPISERVLQHYRGSINELGRRNALGTSPTEIPSERVRRGSDATPG